MSLGRSILVLGFANLLMQGLAIDTDVQSSRKPQIVQVASNKSTEAPCPSTSSPKIEPVLANTNASESVQTPKPGQTNDQSTTPAPDASSTEKEPSSANASESTVGLQDTTTPSSSTASTNETNEPTLPVTNTSSLATSSTKISETTTQAVEAANSTMPATEKTNVGMSSGIMALVMAISFAVAVIIVYAGLLLWRRYLEYRYGNRELLVNDLEFDTNDLRHFEL